MTSPCSLLTVGFFLAAAPVFAAGSAIPERQSLDRYQDLSKDSPFAVATPPAPPTEGPKKFTDGLYVSSMAKDYDTTGKEVAFVGIKSRGEQTTFSLYGTEPGYDGISIGGIQWSDQPGKGKVTLKKGDIFEIIEFDPQVIQAPAGASAPPPQQRMPGNRGMGGMPPVGGRILPRSPGSNVVPRPSAPAVLPQSSLPAANPAAGRDSGTNRVPAERQRLRVITPTP